MAYKRTEIPEDWKSITEIAKEFGVSRHTIKKGIDMLEDLEAMEQICTGKYPQYRYSPKSAAAIYNAIDDILSVPLAQNGWMNFRQMQAHLDVSRLVLLISIDELKRQSNEKFEVKKYRNHESGRTLNYFSPATITALRKMASDLTAGKNKFSRFGGTRVPGSTEMQCNELMAPIGWKTLFQMTKEWNANILTLKKKIEKLGKLETKEYKCAVGSLRTHYSPEAVATIYSALEDYILRRKAKKMNSA